MLPTLRGLHSEALEPAVKGQYSPGRFADRGGSVYGRRRSSRVVSLGKAILNNPNRSIPGSRREHTMNLKILSLLAAVLLVAACQQSQPATGGAAGAGAAGAATTSSQNAQQQMVSAGDRIYFSLYLSGITAPARP